MFFNHIIYYLGEALLVTRAFPEQTRQENGAYKQAASPEPMLKNREFLQSSVLNLPDLYDIVEIPNHQIYITVSSFFPTEIQESIWPASFELSEPLAFPPALSSIVFQGGIIMSLPYLNTRDLWYCYM